MYHKKYIATKKPQAVSRLSSSTLLSCAAEVAFPAPKTTSFLWGWVGLHVANT